MFVTVPETTLPGGRIVPPFQVGQFLAGHANDRLIAINADRAPWVRINYTEAQEACKKAGYQLITESQALALAYQIAAQDENWIGGKVGAGRLYQGLRKGGVSCAQASNIVASVDPTERRWFALPGGERIYDAAGNAFTWVFDDVQGDQAGLVAQPFAADSPSLVIPYPAKDKGQGWTPEVGRNWPGYALLRGGCWYSEADAGVFYLGYGWPGLRVDDVGFRCTK